jgi:hypothetical protein
MLDRLSAFQAFEGGGGCDQSPMSVSCIGSRLSYSVASVSLPWRREMLQQMNCCAFLVAGLKGWPGWVVADPSGACGSLHSVLFPICPINTMELTEYSVYQCANQQILKLRIDLTENMMLRGILRTQSRLRSKSNRIAGRLVRFRTGP